MKPTNVIDIKREGDLGGSKVAMKIDPNSVAHLMTVLTDLYSNPEEAIVREYSTNAWDSHVMAGVTRPIEISTPNNMSPYFKVKDFGLGMSVEDIEQTYSQYGASTKRADNTATGMLGLGCKSALTYTSQFTITAVKDGVKSIVMVSRVEDGTGVMEIVDTSPSSETNSVEISIPVKQGHTLNKTIHHFFQFWDEGRVLIDGMPSKRMEGKSVTDKFLIVGRESGLSSDMIVMGGVAYPVKSLWGGQRDYYNPFKVIAFVEIGEVNFTPSREALHDTPLTNAKVAVLKNEFKASLGVQIQQNIDEAKSHSDALMRYLDWSKTFADALPAKPNYRGEAMETRWTERVTVWDRNRTRNTISQGTMVDHTLVKQAIIVKGFPFEKDVSPRQKQKMVALMTNQGVHASKFVLCADQPGLPWVKPVAVLKWADVISYKLPPSQGTGVKRVTKYECYTEKGYADTPVDDIDASKPVYYSTPREIKKNSNVTALTKALGGCTIVILGENRLKRFKERFPNAVTVNAAINARVDSVTNALSAADKINLGMDYYDKNILSVMDDTLVNDPVIKDAIKTAKGLLTSVAMTTYAESIKVLGNYKYIQTISAPSIFSNYPLLKGNNTQNVRHAYLYINAVYAAKQNGVI